MSDAEEAFAFHCRVAANVPKPEREYRFDPSRRWRFDFAWPPQKLAVEIEGGTFSGGRHTRGSGFEADAEKYAEAVLAGWRVLRVSTAMVTDGRALRLVERAFRADLHGGAK